MISQSAQFAPFTNNYLYNNGSTEDWEVYNTSISRPNNYRYVLYLFSLSNTYDVLSHLLQGIRFVSYIPFCPIASHHILEPHRQQAVSGITELPPDVYEGSGQNFHTFGLLTRVHSLCLSVLIGIAQASNTLEIPAHVLMGTSPG